MSAASNRRGRGVDRLTGAAAAATTTTQECTDQCPRRVLDQHCCWSKSRLSSWAKPSLSEFVLFTNESGPRTFSMRNFNIDLITSHPVIMTYHQCLQQLSICIFCDQLEIVLVIVTDTRVVLVESRHDC
jgi:hypothetical protein